MVGLCSSHVAWVAVALLVVGTLVSEEFSYLAEFRTTVCEEGAKVCARDGLLTSENVREAADFRPVGRLLRRVRRRH